MKKHNWLRTGGLMLLVLVIGVPLASAQCDDVEEQKLLASNGAPDDRFGWVALDGDLAVVTAWLADGQPSRRPDSLPRGGGGGRDSSRFRGRHAWQIPRRLGPAGDQRRREIVRGALCELGLLQIRLLRENERGDHTYRSPT